MLNVLPKVEYEHLWSNYSQPSGCLLSDPVVLLYNVYLPIATFRSPVVFACKAKYPLAVFSCPPVLKYIAVYPLAVLFPPVVLLYNANFPMAMLRVPEVLEKQRLSSYLVSVRVTSSIII